MTVAELFSEARVREVLERMPPDMHAVSISFTVSELLAALDAGQVAWELLTRDLLS